MLYVLHLVKSSSTILCTAGSEENSENTSTDTNTDEYCIVCCAASVT